MKNKIIYLLILIVLICSGCSKAKESITSSEFKDIMKESNYYVINTKDQYEKYSYIKDSYIAIDYDGRFQIEFYEFDSDTSALSFYNSNKEVFQASEVNDSIYTNVDENEYNKYTLTLEYSYKVISRIDDTVIYIDADKEYKNEIQNILKKIGY